MSEASVSDDGGDSKEECCMEPSAKKPTASILDDLMGEDVEPNTDSVNAEVSAFLAEPVVR